MLVFPELVLQGQVPNRDFLHLYGPGSLWALAGIFKVFGTTLATERGGGLAAAARGGVRRLCPAAPLGSLGSGSRWGHGGGHPRTHHRPHGPGVDRRSRPRPLGAELRARWPPRAAGGCWSWPGSWRGLRCSTGPTCSSPSDCPPRCCWGGLERGERVRLAAAFAVGVSPYLVHVAMAGFGNVVEGLILRAGVRPPRRAQPSVPTVVEPLRRVPAAGRGADRAVVAAAGAPTPAQLSLWLGLLIAANAALVFMGIRAARRGDRRLLALALFSVGLLPQAIQRADSTHLAWVSCVPLGLLPAAVIEAQRAWRPRWGALQAGVAAAAVPVVATLVLAPTFVWGVYADYVGRSFGLGEIESGTMRRGDRVFHYGRLDAVAAVNDLLPDVDADHAARRQPVRRHRRPAQDAVQRGVPLLPAARARPGDAIHRDGPRYCQRRGLGHGRRAAARRRRHPVVDPRRLGRTQRLPDDSGPTSRTR